MAVELLGLGKCALGKEELQWVGCTAQDGGQPSATAAGKDDIGAGGRIARTQCRNALWREQRRLGNRDNFPLAAAYVQEPIFGQQAK